MWTALFTIAIATAIGFVLAALMCPEIGNTARRRKNRGSLMAEFAAGCRELTRTVCAAFEPKWPARGHASAAAPDAGDARLAGSAATDWRVPSFATTVWRDASLFPRRLLLLHIDPDEFACAEPVICRQLAIRCERCRSAMQCAQDLSDDSTDLFDEQWRDYCPNAAVLSAIATLRGSDSSFGAGRDARRPTTTSPARS